MTARAAGTSTTVRFRLNGTECAVETRADAHLVDLLRDSFGLTSAKVGCSVGRCGSCMVLANGSTVNSCLAMAWQIEGADIVSPEGLDMLPVARIVREALIEEVSFQCGYCAPGFTVSLTALLASNPNADEAEIRRALEGNICRCTGYLSILRGAALAAERARKMAGV
jgi:carbon-monoxide dehydrogenase small subunit